jgi:Protein of unknown function DUF262/HNH endonuclease
MAATVRVRKALLPSGSKVISQRIGDLVASLDEKVDLHPIYQREIRWGKEKMDALIGTVMESGVIPALLLYKLKDGDERKSPSFRWECIDGQHRLFVFAHFLRGRTVSLNGREWVVTWKHVDEDGQVTHVFFEETEDTKRWVAAHPRERYDYMTEEERDHFSEFTVELKEIHKDPLTLEQRCAIFTSLQQGVQVRGSDLLKNYTGVRLVQFIQYEKKWETAFKNVLQTRCHLNAANFWLHWAIRCFFILFPTADKDMGDSFKLRDSKIGQMIKANDPRLDSTEEQEEVLACGMERFFAYLESLPAGVKLSPPKFFALFSHLAGAAAGREDILRGHMADWAADLPSSKYKKAWENRAVGGDDEEREALFLEGAEQLGRISVPAEELPARKSIPKSIRNRVWTKFFGEEEAGCCQVCEREITLKSWECGHVLAAAAGGKETLDNLRPICRSCNREMGTQHMDEFKERYYSDGSGSESS